MAKEEKAADKGKGKEPAKAETNGVDGAKEPQKDKDGKIVKDGKDLDLPPGTASRW